MIITEKTVQAAIIAQQAVEIKRLQVALALSEKDFRPLLLAEITTELLHELNQPLTTIISYVRSIISLIKLKNTNMAHLLSPLDQIDVNANYISNILNKFLIVDPVFGIELTNINQLITDSLTMLDYELYPMQLILNFAENLTPIKVNATDIMQVVLNLVRNSIEAMQSINEPWPVLSITTTESADSIFVHILDNGPGVALELEHKILNKYFTTKVHGQGIGLGLCRNLIEAHGGKLSICAHAHKGAWFTFTLLKLV